MTAYTHSCKRSFRAYRQLTADNSCSVNRVEPRSLATVRSIDIPSHDMHHSLVRGACERVPRESFVSAYVAGRVCICCWPRLPSRETSMPCKNGSRRATRIQIRRAHSRCLPRCVLDLHISPCALSQKVWPPAVHADMLVAVVPQ